MLRSGIYKISLKNTDKCYIGSAVNLVHRWNNHCHELNNNRHFNIHLQRAWNKYGSEKFIFEVIERCKRKDLIKLEQYHIDSQEPYYNISPTAGSTLGVRPSKKTLRRMSESRKGFKYSEETKRKMSASKIGNTNASGNKGKPKSEQHSKKISEGRKLTKKIKCESCGILSQPHMYSRWHGDNCTSSTKDIVGSVMKLHGKGFSNSAIANLVGRDRRTVREIIYNVQYDLDNT